MMALARTSLKSFLVQARAKLRASLSEGHKLTFVIGNESADLDSLTSSLLLAYIRSTAPPANAFSRFYIPITNIPALDIKLRPEFHALLRYANLQTDDLITLDDLPPIKDIATKLQPDQTRWLLVDHNALQGALGSVYSNEVIGGIDHHDEEHEIPEDTGAEPRIIVKSGSCTSLVANYCRNGWDSISTRSFMSDRSVMQRDENVSANDDATSLLWDAQMAQLALASVLIDTANMKDESKVTKHDIEAVQYLEAKIIASIQGAKSYDRDRYYQEMSDAKQDIDNLRLHDILRKDYKQWTEGSQTVGISSVVKNLDFLVDKAINERAIKGKDDDAFLEAVASFTKDKNLDLFAIMTNSTSASGDFRRELFLLASDAASVQTAIRFGTDTQVELGLADWHGAIHLDSTEDIKWCKVWRQQNVQHSRKRVAPLLRAAMKAGR